MSEKKAKDTRRFGKVEMSKADLPKPTQLYQRYGSAVMVPYGQMNRYPDFLLLLYSESPTHAAIVNNKATYIYGGGLRYKGETYIDEEGNVKPKPIDTPLNTKEPIGATVDKLIKDFKIFNYFVVEVIYNRFGRAVQYIHVPGHLIRTNMERSKFWFRENWTGGLCSSIEFDAADSTVSEDEAATSKIFFFDGYLPSVNICYPAPEYIAGVKGIATDAAINTFNLTNIKTHFSPSSIVTFFMGNNVDETTKAETEKALTDSYTGESGGKMIVDWQTLNGKPAEVNTLSPGEWDKAYSVTAGKVQADIFIAHQVTNPMLMGVKTEGQLGGATELETAYAIFKATYIDTQRTTLEGAFNRLFKNSAIITGDVEFIEKPLVFVSAETPATEPKAPAPVATPPTVPDVPTPTEQNKDRAGWVKRVLKEEDFNSVSHLGLSKDDFTVVSYGEAVRSHLAASAHAIRFDRIDDLTQKIVNDDISGMTTEELVNALNEEGYNTNIDEIKGIFETIKSAGVANIEETDGKIKVTVDKTQDIPDGSIVTMYEYVKRPEASGADLLPTSRGFCVKMVNNNKLYSRQDIQAMSSIFGYDVFTHAGGWWHNPDTGNTEEHCRHTFRSIRVKKKNKD